ncbi:MAG TPA: AbrB/MazE/SpoVT family DNA-binding domain-containing protein [Terriglobales bacterium]|nr:AbrB/MazE/SpoVT family DNA-binding domain-containing protein [Terriglobales bacterium]
MTAIFCRSREAVRTSDPGKISGAEEKSRKRNPKHSTRRIEAVRRSGCPHTSMESIHEAQDPGIPGAIAPSLCGRKESRNQESTVEIRHCQSQAQVEVTIKVILDTKVVISGLASQRSVRDNGPGKGYVEGKDNPMLHSTVTSKGQTTIPGKIRKALRIKPGDRLEYVVQGDRATIRVHPGTRSLKGVLASKKGKRMPFAQIREAAAEAARHREGFR